MSDLSDFGRLIADAAYDGTPETMFVMRLGREFAALLNVPGGQSLVEPLMSRLVDPSLSEQLPVGQKDRFRVLQALLLTSFARHAGFLPETPMETKH